MSSEITFKAIHEPPGITIRDTIQGGEVVLNTDDDISLVETTTDFIAPVDSAVRVVGLSTFQIHIFVKVYVRDTTGAICDMLSDNDDLRVQGTKYIEFGGLDCKVYLRLIEGEAILREEVDGIEIDIISGEVEIGARSLHELPEATITIPPEPAALATAIGSLHSSVKTRSVERSYPTLRGHPPRLQLGEELTIPDQLSSFDTEITITVPSDISALFTVAPLAFYLLADVQTGEPARLTIGEMSVPLDLDSLSEQVGQLLKQTFTFDCATRTEGLYPVDLAERNQLEERTSLDFQALYDEPLETQIQAYLDVPYDEVADILPRWKQTADVRPVIENTPALSHLTHSLSMIRTPSYTKHLPQSIISSMGIEKTPKQERSSAHLFQRLFEPDETDSLEHIYIGKGIPMRGAKLTVDDLERRLNRTETKALTPEVAVVVNDEQMMDEQVVSEVYAENHRYELNIEIFEFLNQGELREVLSSGYEQLHFIGHSDDRGIECTDGYLDVRDIDTVDIGMFLLNACESMDQARELVKTGAIAGMGANARINTDAATNFGVSVARLLTQGYSLLQTLYILQQGSIMANRFLIFGDGAASLLHREGWFPLIAYIDRVDDAFAITFEAFPKYTPGSIVTPITDKSTHYVKSGTLDTWHVGENRLFRILASDIYPVLLNREDRSSSSFHLSDELSMESLLEAFPSTSNTE